MKPKSSTKSTDGSPNDDDNYITISSDTESKLDPGTDIDDATEDDTNVTDIQVEATEEPELQSMSRRMSTITFVADTAQETNSGAETAQFVCKDKEVIAHS